MNDEKDEDVRVDMNSDHEIMMDILSRLRDMGVSPRSLSVGSVSIELSPEALIRDRESAEDRRARSIRPTSYVEKALLNGPQVATTTHSRTIGRRSR